ncbi:hypothetical protein Q9L42_004635 [Methylomarinum sp. Ch1-1]|uniref:Uncharacterized protein n=1 Tax=Methylomarinum roseum TaxID=3067653 RepID=A0AAU7NXR6_9GAMM|nr:hypothetical protein [Methylomarinum sp. Ch1-1]MDP4522515.1 hypothetical protein [Methylomarinum sp. Ch1-1]
MRDAGYSLASIADKTGISIATLARHFKRHGVSKGSLTDESVELARQQLLSDAGFIDSLKAQIAASIVDDLAHVRQLRTASAILLEEMLNDKNLPPHYKTRGVAALSTSLRLTQEAARKALRVDELEPEPSELPELIVSELTAAEIEEMRKEQQSDSVYDLPAPEEIEIVEES